MIYWTDKEKEALRDLIAQGLTGEVISHQLSILFNRPITRSSCNGQAGRMGLKLGIQRRAKPKPSPKHKVPSTAPQGPIDAKIKMRPCTIFQLRDTRCHYPLWPDHLRASPEYLFCGAPVNHSPYCKEHERVVYNRSHRLPSVSLTTMNVPVKPAKSIIL